MFRTLLNNKKLGIKVHRIQQDTRGKTPKNSFVTIKLFLVVLKEKVALPTKSYILVLKIGGFIN